MKVEISKSKKICFKPFKLTLSIETIEDLKELHNRFNLNHNHINEVIGNKWCRRFEEESRDGGIFKALDILDNELDEFCSFNPIASDEMQEAISKIGQQKERLLELTN